MNKADRPGADHAMTSIEFILGLRPPKDQDWPIRVVKTQALEGKGIADVVALIDQHHRFLQSSNALVERRKKQLNQRIHGIINERWHFDFWTSERTAYAAEQIEQVFSRFLTPYDVAEELIRHFKQR